MTRYLVTGASGFLGSHVVAALLEVGHEVVALSRSGTSSTTGDRLIVKKGDVLDAASIKDAAAGCSGAFHCAGNVSRKPEDAESLYEVHVEGTKTMLAACKDAGLSRVVVASSSGTVAVSDDPDHVATENDETPIGILHRWPYYRAKLFAEKAALSANEAGFEVVCVNPTLLLGPGDLHGSSTEDVKLFLERKIPAVPPGGLSFVDVRDAARAMTLAMTKGVPGKRYLIGACNLTVREFFARLERASGVRAPSMPMPRAPTLSRMGATLLAKAMDKVGLRLPVDAVSLEMSQYFWYLDSSLAERELGWTHRDPSSTLQATVDDLKGRGVVWPSEATAP
ncbi:NAD-dependent epimerase/dehydratase family protein [soil metagenome]